jgi:hypothetical protein
MRNQGSWAALLLLVLSACQRPVVVPDAGERWIQALENRSREAARVRSPAEQAEYREGFLNGARMVRQAQDRGQRPFAPVLGAGPAPVPVGALPPGVSLQAAAPRLEIDPETGLQIAPAMGSSEGFAQGQVEGFRWAWDQVKGSYAPPVQPTLPASWTPWEQEASAVKVSDPDQTGEVLWRSDTLMWMVKASGFPGRARWRPFPWGRPVAVALNGGALWVATKEGQALALDLEHGAIRSLQAAPPRAQAQGYVRDPGFDPRKAFQDWLRAERQKPEAVLAREGLRSRAGKGEAEAMFKLAESLKGIDEPSNREAFGWLRKASDLGHGGALMELGAWHYQGYLIPEDKAEGRRCFERAAKLGRADALELLKALDASAKPAN